MQQERWERIDDLFHRALQVDAGSRGAYLEETCSGDAALRLELERLLACHTEAESFLESPAMELMAGQLHSPAIQPRLEGTLVSHYRVIRQIGSGGMGVVYEAEDLRLRRRVALKFIAETLTHDRKAVDRFEAEARAASSLNHPNICTIYEVEEYDNQPVIVMELLAGQNLTHRIQAGPTPLEELTELGAQVADALAAAHHRGIVHRDIKPANMFLSSDGRLKLLDFGIAKLAPTASRAEGSATFEHGLVGTLPYMSPEQIRGEDVDGRSDLFSLGVVLYELATGERPLGGSSPSLAANAALHAVAPAPSSVNRALSPEIDRVIAQLLEKDPERRYQQAEELAADLRQLGKHRSRTARRPWLIPGVIAAAALASIGGTMLYRSSHLPILTGKDKLVLADFANATGDPVFDGTLRQGLAVQLEQSPYLSLISDERIGQTLQLMKQPIAAKFTPELASEVCQRLASAAVLDGSITRLGNQYVLGFRARACGSGELLDHQQLQVKKKEDVLDGLSRIAARFRAHAGESLASLHNHDVALAEATTPSLDALKAYTTAWNTAPKVGPAEVIPLLRHAIALDGEFAMAHAFLARIYGDIWEGELSEKSIRRAYELRYRTTEPEKLFITINYHQQATGNTQKALETAEEWARTYERDVRPHAFLSWLYQNFGRYSKSAEEGSNAIALDPDFTPGYMNLAWAYIFLEKPDAAKGVLERAAKRKLYMPEMLVARYYLAFLKGNAAEMAELETQGEDKPGAQDWMKHQRATVAAYGGHLLEADQLSRDAADLALHDNERERAGMYQAAAAVRNALFGDMTAAQQLADAALKTSHGRDVTWGAALAFSLSGVFRRSQVLQDDLEKRYPEDTYVRFTYLPILRAIEALHHGKPEEALERLRIAAPFDFAVPGSWSGFFGNMYPVYFRGLAYLAAGKNDLAAVEFQKILAHPGFMFADPVFALVHLELGRAAKRSDPARARAAYRDFLNLWKDADADIPILRKAREEYTSL